MAKILLICKDALGEKMAGPGIRSFEIARELSKNHAVTLAGPEPVNLSDKQFKIIGYNKRKETKDLGEIVKNFDLVIAQFLKPSLLEKIRKNNIRYIADLYDPLIIETLEHFKDQPDSVSAINFDFQRYLTILQILYSDLILCASEKQKDYYIGLFSAIGKLNDQLFRRDPRLERTIITLPFGIEEAKESLNDDLIRKIIPNYQKDDQIIIWGGGIWNWFDPLTVILAIDKLKDKLPKVKLIFIGVKHPNPDIPKMAMVEKALNLAKKLGLLNTRVFFNFGWVEYNDRHQLFDRAIIGVSTHFNELETRFSFRTRILDYIGHKKPIIATRGDSMSELILRENLGTVVDFEDVEGVCQAIFDLITNKEKYRQITDNLEKVRQKFFWREVVKPLAKIIDHGLQKSDFDHRKGRRVRRLFYQTAINRVASTQGIAGVIKKAIGK